MLTVDMLTVRDCQAMMAPALILKKELQWDGFDLLHESQWSILSVK
jgi:hypothetical protein